MTVWQTWTVIFFVAQVAGIMIANGVYRRVTIKVRPLHSIVYWTVIGFMLAICACIFSALYLFIQRHMPFHYDDPIFVVVILLLSVHLGIRLKRERAEQLDKPE